MKSVSEYWDDPKFIMKRIKEQVEYRLWLVFRVGMWGTISYERFRELEESSFHVLQKLKERLRQLNSDVA